MASKQGAELALNVVIVAAIGLIVLVVMIFILSGRTAIFTRGVSSCETLGGECLTTPCVGTPQLFGGDCKVSEGQPQKYCCQKTTG